MSAALERVELVDARARDQRRVDLEVRVLGGRADQRDQALLHRGQQRVLLGLVEAVDLVEEEDRCGGRRCAGARARARSPRAPRRGRPATALSSSKAAPGALGDEPRERRLAAAGRPVQDHRVRAALLERAAQRRARRQQAILADELIERRGPHARGERGVGAPAPAGSTPPRVDRCRTGAPWPRVWSRWAGDPALAPLETDDGSAASCSSPLRPARRPHQPRHAGEVGEAPPASSTITCGAARSQSEAAGSTARSAAPSARSM